MLVARAPGRLDVMGGIADYSGSLVLELPLDVATWVAAQADDASDAIVIESGDAGGGTATPAAASASRWRSCCRPSRSTTRARARC